MKQWFSSRSCSSRTSTKVFDFCGVGPGKLREPGAMRAGSFAVAVDEAMVYDESIKMRAVDRKEAYESSCDLAGRSDYVRRHDADSEFRFEST